MCFQLCFCNSGYTLRSIYQYSNMDPRLLGQNCKFLKCSFSFNSPKRFGYAKSTTKYRQSSWKPRSPVTILIYRTWPIAEYSTENELLTSLQNGTEDKVWLFDCPAKEINPDLDFTIVSVLDDEFMRQKPSIGVKVIFLNRSHFDENFTKCLEKENLKMKKKLEPHSGAPSASRAQSGTENESCGTETKDWGMEAADYDDVTFWEQDVRKHCLILLTALLLFCEFLSHLLSPNVSPKVTIEK